MSLNPLGELANLKQRTTVEDYQQQFQSLSARTQELNSSQQIGLFTAGLKEDLRLEVELQKPNTLGAAMNLARTFERKHRSIFFARRNSRPATTSEKGASGPIQGVGHTPTPFFKKITKEEIEERKAKGLCFKCDKAYSRGHKCKRKEK